MMRIPFLTAYLERRNRLKKPKLSTLEIGQMVYVKGHKEVGPRVVVSKLLTCDAVTIDQPVNGLMMFDSDQLEAVK